MKLMDRYLLKEYLVTVIYCVLGISMIYVLLDLFGYLSRFMKARTPLPIIALYYLYWILPFLEYLLPAALMFATLYTLWRLSRNNELVAMRASGVSLYRIMLPFMGVGLFFTVITAVVKEVVIPHTDIWVAEFRKNRFEPIQANKPFYVRASYNNTLTRHVWQVEKIDIRHPHKLFGVEITEDREDGSKARTIRAKRAEWLDGRWWLFGATSQDYHPGPFPHPKGEPRKLSAEGKELAALTTEPRDIVSEVKALKGWTNLSVLEMLRYAETHPDLPRTKWVRLHLKLAMPWACFIVTLFAIPAGARNSRQNILTGIFFALACFFCFYALIQAGIFLGNKGILWPWLGAWLSNIVFLVAGIAATRSLR